MSRAVVEQPFRVDVDYYEGRADGIATVAGVSVEEARHDLAVRHGFGSWGELAAHVAAIRDGKLEPPPFMLAYRAPSRAGTLRG